MLQLMWNSSFGTDRQRFLFHFFNIWILGKNLLAICIFWTTQPDSWQWYKSMLINNVCGKQLVDKMTKYHWLIFCNPSVVPTARTSNNSDFIQICLWQLQNTETVKQAVVDRDHRHSSRSAAWLQICTAELGWGRAAVGKNNRRWCW